MRAKKKIQITKKNDRRYMYGNIVVKSIHHSDPVTIEEIVTRYIFTPYSIQTPRFHNNKKYESLSYLLWFSVHWPIDCNVHKTKEY